MVRAVRLREVVVLASIVLASPALAACSPTSDSQPCMPPPFALSPATAQPGGSVTVTAEDASCNPRYGENAQIQLEVHDGSGAKVLDMLAPMNDPGGFSVSVELPAAAVPGQGTVAAHPYNLDWCDDTGRNNRVGAQGGAEIQRTSCALRSQTLQIEP